MKYWVYILGSISFECIKAIPLCLPTYVTFYFIIYFTINRFSMAFSKDEIEHLAQITIGQSVNPLWRQLRIGRIFSTLIIEAIKIADALNQFKGVALDDLPWTHKRNITWLRKCLLEFRRLDGIPEIDWGNNHEREGISAYVKKTGYNVQETGVWLSPSGFLTCSPDGLVYPNRQCKHPEGILEVKCPYKLRNYRNISSSDWNQRLPYLDSNLKIDTRHKFYHRAQTEIYATNTEWCDFIVWAPRGMLITRVEKDEDWIRRNIPLVENFFETYLLPTSPIQEDISSRRKNMEKEKMKKDKSIQIRKRRFQENEISRRMNKVPKN